MRILRTAMMPGQNKYNYTVHVGSIKQLEQEDDIKGSVLLDMVAQLRMQYCRDREIERSFRNFYGAYLFSKSVI